MPVLDHLNSQARQAVGRADGVAHGLAHQYVGTEHLLAGLAGVEGCAAERALARCGLGADGVASRVEQLVGRGPHALAVAPPRTAAVELVLARSRWEARALGEDVVTSAHLLLALLHHAGSTATTVLRDLGVDPDRLEGFVLADPSDGPAADAESRPVTPGAGPVPAGPVPADPGEPLAVRVVLLQRQVDRLEAEVARLTAIVGALAGSSPAVPDPGDPDPPARR